MSNLNMGRLHLERGHIDQAAQVFMDALNKDFHDPEAIALLASCFLAREQYGAAANLLTRAIEVKPLAECFQNLGACYRGVNKNAQAEEIFDMGLEMARSPRMRAEFLSNKAGCYVNNGTPEKARELFAQAAAIDPNNISVQFNRCWPELESGDWKEGFRLYDLGFLSGNRAYRTYEGVKPYKPGMDLKGKTVIVWGDQGIGDEIMFASCIPDLMKEAGRVIFDCHPRLVRLFERSFGIECHGTRKTQQMDWHLSSGADISIPISTLATIYRSNGAFPGTAYLKADRPKNARPKIGIAWSGGIDRTRKDLRSVALAGWADLLRADADWYSLQYTDTAAQEVMSLEEATGIHVKHFPGKVQCDDYATTADFVAGLDLVISVCTSVVHLAGALGVPCWCLTPSRPAWRYGCEGDQMPWYRSVRLFRQTGDDWSSVFNNVVGALDDYLNH